MGYLILLLVMLSGAARAEWFPVNATLDGKPGRYEALPRAAKPWRVCVLLPHARDRYWWAVSWGIAQEAERLGIQVGIYQAGGYEFLAQQRRQFADCLARQADAIVLGAISGDGLNGDIAAAVQQGVPVIDLINGVSSRDVAARSLVNFADAVTAAMRPILVDAHGRPVKLLWFPGPKDAGWVNDAEQGLRRALQGTSVELIHGGYAPTDASSQMNLVRAQLKNGVPDYVLGNAIACELAANYFRYQGHGRSKIVAYYATEPIVELIRHGDVLAAASDGTVLQSRIALDLAVRILEKKAYPKRVAPAIELLDAQSLPQYDISRLLAPVGHRFIQKPLPPR
jgi:protein TorT